MHSATCSIWSREMKQKVSDETGAIQICCSTHTLLDWVKKAEVDSGKRAGVTSDLADKLKALERENRELRQANEILRKASAYFAQAELDSPFKR